MGIPANYDPQQEVGSKTTELYPKRKSDAEYIAWVRKQVSRTKWYATFHGIMFIVSIGLFPALNRLVFQFHEIIPTCLPLV